MTINYTQKAKAAAAAKAAAKKPTVKKGTRNLQEVSCTRWACGWSGGGDVCSRRAWVLACVHAARA